MPPPAVLAVSPLPRIDAGGWLAAARRVPSANRDPRPPGTGLSLVVVHGISLPPGRFGGGHVDALFTNRLDARAHPYFAAIAGLRLSAHVLIDRAGTLTQYVSFHERAWHAGESCFQGVAQCNDFSIGIELEGTDDQPYDDAQYAALVPLVRALAARWPAITPERVVGHADIAPGRKTDPGPHFDWRRLRDALAAGGLLPRAEASRPRGLW